MLNTAEGMSLLVVDDEDLARARLVRMLREPSHLAESSQGTGIAMPAVPGFVPQSRPGSPQISNILEARNGAEALELIERARPDGVFMDVCMPGRHGIEVAGSMSDFPPVVFVSGHDKYASTAFDVDHVVDYLVKPVAPDKLARSLRRLHARSRGPEAEVSPSASEPGNGPRAEGPDLPHRLPVRSADGIRFYDVQEVTRFYSRDKYACFIADGREQLVERSLTSLESKLAPFGFCRIHRSELINLNHVLCLRLNTQPAEIDLRDGQTVRTSRRMLSDVKRRLGL